MQRSITDFRNHLYESRIHVNCLAFLYMWSNNMDSKQMTPNETVKGLLFRNRAGLATEDNFCKCL